MPHSIDTLKNQSLTGQVITEQFLHNLIESCHNELAELDSSDGVQSIPDLHNTGGFLNWVHHGPIYSFWTSGAIDNTMAVPYIPAVNEPAIKIFDGADIPPLHQNWQGAAMRRVATLTNGHPETSYNVDTDFVLVTIDATGIWIRSTNAAITVNQGDELGLNFTLILHNLS